MGRTSIFNIYFVPPMRPPVAGSVVAFLCALWWTPRAAEDGLPDVAFGHVMIAWRTRGRVRKVQDAVQVTSDVKCVCRQVCAVFQCIGHFRVAIGFGCVTACKCLDMCSVAVIAALGPRWVQ